MKKHELEILRTKYKNHLRKSRDGLMILYILLSIITFFGIMFVASAQEPHVLKSHMTHQDADYYYHLQTLSTGSNKVHKVRKPKPPNPDISSQLIATNDLPVQLQYVYRVLYQDLTVRTNTITRTKTARERTHIKLPELPPMPELQPRGKTDALGHALKKSREELAIDRIRTGPITERQELEDRFIFTFQNGEIKTHLKKEMTPTFIARARGEINKAKPVDITHKQMQKRDPIVYREIKDGIVVNYTKSGQIIEQAVKRVYSAKLESVGPFAPPTQEDIDRGDVHINHGHGPNHRKPR